MIGEQGRGMIKQHIILMGVKHCGKSTLGQRIARKLNKEFYDLDDKILELQGDDVLTPRELFRKKGASYFQKIETLAGQTLFESLGSTHQAVIALGGGNIDNSQGMEIVRHHGYLVYLEEKPDILYERIMRSGIPPFFDQNKNIYDQFIELYNTRSEKYEQYADMKFFLNSRSPQAAEIFLIEQLKRKGYVW
ncbi:MAG: shikimate kinase [Bacteroidota bacterium]